MPFESLLLVPTPLPQNMQHLRKVVLRHLIVKSKTKKSILRLKVCNLSELLIDLWESNSANCVRFAFSCRQCARVAERAFCKPFKPRLSRKIFKKIQRSVALDRDPSLASEKI